jgi:hypothetical protein
MYVMYEMPHSGCLGLPEILGRVIQVFKNATWNFLYPTFRVPEKSGLGMG